MRILITGATGLIGKKLVSLLLQKGIVVHYLTTSPSKIIIKDNYHGFYWNPQQGIIDENCFLDVDVIVHLAGANISKRWTNAYKQELIESRILSSNLLFKVLKDNPNQVKQIISASGIAIYPNSDKVLYTEESSEVEDSFLGNLVVKWEQSVDIFNLLDIKVCKIRTGVVLSKKGGALTEMLKPVKLGVGSPYGNGKQMTSWIHIDDLIGIYYFAVQNSLQGVFNAVATNPVTNKELIHSIAKTLDKPFFFPAVPRFVFKLLLGEMHELLFTNQKISNNKIINAGYTFKFNTVSQALANILKPNESKS